jgi:hypothetical protein
VASNDFNDESDDTQNNNYPDAEEVTTGDPYGSRFKMLCGGSLGERNIGQLSARDISYRAQLQKRFGLGRQQFWSFHFGCLSSFWSRASCFAKAGSLSKLLCLSFRIFDLCQVSHLFSPPYNAMAKLKTAKVRRLPGVSQLGKDISGVGPHCRDLSIE